MDLDRYYSSGRYGNSREIAQAAAPRFERAGVPSNLANGFTMHPILDYSLDNILANNVISNIDQKDSRLSPVQGSPLNIDRWFNRDHPLDDEVPQSFDFNSNEHRVKDCSPQLTEQIIASHHLLSDIVPHLWASCIPFVTRVYGINDSNFMGGSIDEMQGALVLGESQNSNLIDTSANLLHEAVHNKSYRLFRAFSETKTTRTNEWIEIPWWKTGTGVWRWSTHRAFVATHVYAHLGAFYDAAISKFGSTRSLLNSRDRVKFRARYLGNILAQLPAILLDEDRRSLVEWSLEGVDVAPSLNDAGRQALRVAYTDFPTSPMLV